MKKIISITMAIMLLLSSVFMTTAFAKTASADEPTTYPASTIPGLDAETELEIKQEIFNMLADDNIGIDDIELKYYGALSDGSILILYQLPNISSDYILNVDEIGSYFYPYLGPDQVYIYKNHTLCSIKDAYNTGVISDAVLDEAAGILTFISKDDLKTPGLDDETALEIRQTILERGSMADNGYTKDVITLEYFGTLSDGSILIRYQAPYLAYDSAVHVDKMGQYNYTYGASEQIFLYNNHTLYKIKDAYDTGVISDTVLDEIAKILNFTSVNGQTEPTVPNVTDETKPQTTPDTVAVANVNNSNSDNSAIQTGQNASSVLAATGIVILLAAGALLVIRRRFV